MKKTLSILLLLFMLTPKISVGATENSSAIQSADASTEHSKNTQDKSDKDSTITMTALQGVKLAGRLVDIGDYTKAIKILTQMPQTNNLSIEIERWYLLAQIEQNKGNYDEAIKIYRKILDDQPDLVKVRYELALCYMAKKQWYRADYHLRLAMAGHDIPSQIKQRMMYYRWIARQNKNWNVWFNFGAAPDNNVNQASNNQICGNIVCSGNICIIPKEQVCINQEPEKAIGYNLILGGNYEFRFGEHWRWKNEANIYTNIYDKHYYDDLYLSLSLGPRYVWSRGDVWLAGIGARRWYGWNRYNWAMGGKIDTNYDWTRKLSTGLSLRIMANKYDEYGDYMNGQTYSVYNYASYSLDATKYIVLHGNIDRDTAKTPGWADWRYGAGIGFGSELPLGFHIYLEPYFTWTNYDGPRWFMVSDNDIVSQTQITEHDFLQRYSVSISNNKFDIWGFVPTMTFGYTKRDSNVKTRDYDKITIEFNMQQKF